jgi:hypothetical protein
MVARVLATSEAKIEVLSLQKLTKWSAKQPRFTHNLANNSVEPDVLQLPNGICVPYPKGSILKIMPSRVLAYGEEAVSKFLITEHSHLDKLYNLSLLQYLNLRGRLASSLPGWWIAVNSEGVFVAAATEQRVRDLGEMLFPFPDDNYYADCLGREVMEFVYMESDLLPKEIRMLVCGACCYSLLAALGKSL